MEILKSNDKFMGCDFVVNLDESRKGTKIKILQITDMQFIDSLQRRTADRLRIDEINAWHPDNFDIQGGNQIKSLVAQAMPDLIIITGDIIYGSFDDNGTVMKWFCNFMDQFEIPWAPVFGNHDNESKMGVKYQCDLFENSRYCLFKRGRVTGNGNYTVGIAVNMEIVRILHMLDSNGCYSDDESVIRESGIYPDQMEMIKENTSLILKTQGRKIPAFMAFHIPPKEFMLAEVSKGYSTDGTELFVIGVDVTQKDNDFGCKMERLNMRDNKTDFLRIAKECNVDGVFCGHYHKNNTCIEYEDIKWVFGLKTGQYDYHIPGQFGGTLITLENGDFCVNHLSALTTLAPYPGGASMFNGLFANDKEIEKLN